MGYSQVPAAATNGVQLRYTLTSSGTLTIPGASSASPITATVVCVGGGAGGSSNYLGGTYVSSNVGATTYAVICGGGFGGNAGNVTIASTIITGSVTYIIGAGGTGGATPTTQANTGTGTGGGDSIFGNIIGVGGKTMWRYNNSYNLVAYNMASYSTKPSYGNSNPAAGSLHGAGFSSDGTYGLAYYNDASTTYGTTWKQSTGSHGGGNTPYGSNYSTSGGTTTAGVNGEAGGTYGGGTAGVAALTGLTDNGQATNASTPYATSGNIFSGGGGGGGASGSNNGSGARTGGAGGAASIYGGTGGNGGGGGSATGGATASGGNGTNASGYGAGGGGGGGGASGNTAGITTSNTTLAVGSGGNGSQGVIFIFY